MIVEDDKALVRGLSASLKAMGFAVDHELDGAEAASIAISEPYMKFRIASVPDRTITPPMARSRRNTRTRRRVKQNGRRIV